MKLQREWKALEHGNKKYLEREIFLKSENVALKEELKTVRNENTNILEESIRLKEENSKLTEKITNLNEINMALGNKSMKFTDEEIKLKQLIVELNKQEAAIIKDLSVSSAANETLKCEIATLNATNYKCIRELQLYKEKRVILQTTLKKVSLSLESIKNDDSEIYFYTGVPSYRRLVALYDFLDAGENGENVKLWYAEDHPEHKKNSNSKTTRGRPRKLAPIEQFFLTLVRLRLGLLERDLANRFGVCQSTVSKVCLTWINFIYSQLCQINIWSSRNAIDRTMPAAFKLMYPSTRVIVDATEIRCEVPKSLVLQSNTYSNYKSCNTFKGLIGTTPSGHVSFVSNLFTGNISDKELTYRSGLLDMNFDKGDSLMADKGFLIKEYLQEIGVKLNIPPFLKDKDQFTLEEIELTQQIASLRIHVERRIQRVKSFKMLQTPIPINLAPIVNQIWSVCVLLTNFQNDLIKDP